MYSTGIQLLIPAVFDATNLQTDLLTVTGSGREAHGECLAEAGAIASCG